MERRRAQLEESVARYLAQLDTADRQEPSEELAAKTAHLREKLVKLEGEMQRLVAMEKSMLASPDQQILGLLLLLAITSTFTIGIWSGGNPRVIALYLLATLASVQISYLIGCLIAAQFPARAKTTTMQTRYLRRLSAGAAMR